MAVRAKVTCEGIKENAVTFRTVYEPDASKDAENARFRAWEVVLRGLPSRGLRTMFHVYEPARNTTHPILGTTSADGNNGAFDFESPEPGWNLAVIASDVDGWEHVSVHAYRYQRVEVVGLLGRGSPAGLKERTPTWKEMSYMKRLCWDAEDVVMQLHPRESKYVNCHPNTLHLWRPTNAVIPEPPPEFVGPVNVGSAP